jgi:hypothetical protein
MEMDCLSRKYFMTKIDINKHIPPQYNWNIVESDFKHHDPNPLKNIIYQHFHKWHVEICRQLFKITKKKVSDFNLTFYQW